jgi:hypothetical protein
MSTVQTRPSLEVLSVFKPFMLWLFAAAWPLLSAAQSLQVSLPDYSVCQGGNVTLIPQVSGGTPPYTYIWSPAASLSCADCPEPVAMPPQTTVYSLTVTDSADGEATAVTEVAVVTHPVTMLPIVSICAGDCYAFGGNLYCTPGTYEIPLQSSLGCDSIVTLTLSFVAPQQTVVTTSICQGSSFSVGNQVLTQTGIYTIPLLSSSGCDSMVTVNLTVTPGPTVSVSPLSAAVCAGALFPLTATPVGGAGGCNYQWQISSTPTGPWNNVAGNWNTPQYFPSTQGFTIGQTHYYRVIYTCPGGGTCSSTTSNVIPVAVAPQPSLHISPATTIACVGETVLLTANTSGGTGDCAIQWLSGPSYSGPWTPIPGATDSTYQAPTDVLGTVYYVAQFSCDGNACAAASSSNAAKVVAASEPGIAISPSDSTICPGDPMTYTAVTTLGSDTCVIQWQSALSPEGPWVNIAGATGATYTPPTDSVGTRYYRADYDCADVQDDFDFDFGVQLRIGNAYNVTQGEQFCVDVTTKNFTGVNGMRFSILYDPAALQLLSLENIGLSGFTSHAFALPIPGSTVGNPPGVISVWWPSPSGPVSDTLPDGAVLFTLCFEAITDSGPLPISFAGSPYPTWIEQFFTSQPFYRIPGAVYFGSNCYSAKSNIAPLTVQASPGHLH